MGFVYPSLLLSLLLHIYALPPPLDVSLGWPGVLHSFSKYQRGACVLLIPVSLQKPTCHLITDALKTSHSLSDICPASPCHTALYEKHKCSQGQLNFLSASSDYHCMRQWLQEPRTVMGKHGEIKAVSKPYSLGEPRIAMSSRCHNGQLIATRPWARRCSISPRNSAHLVICPKAVVLEAMTTSHVIPNPQPTASCLGEMAVYCGRLLKVGW